MKRYFQCQLNEEVSSQSFSLGVYLRLQVSQVVASEAQIENSTRREWISLLSTRMFLTSTQLNSRWEEPNCGMVFVGLLMAFAVMFMSQFACQVERWSRTTRTQLGPLIGFQSAWWEEPAEDASGEQFVGARIVCRPLVEPRRNEMN